MNLIESVKTCIKKYAVFKGRATRSEFWYFIFFKIIVDLAPPAFAYYGNDKTGVIVSVMIYLFFVLPSLAVSVRRFHDIGKSGKIFILYYSCLIICMISALLLYKTSGKVFHIIDMITALMIVALDLFIFVNACRDSQPGTNEYGPNPKDDISENC